MEELQKTFLPTAELLNKSRRFGVTLQMPILKLGADKDPSDVEDWAFLQEFGVCCELSLTFYLKVLLTLKTYTRSQDCKNKVIDVYKSIGSISNFECKARVQVCPPVLKLHTRLSICSTSLAPKKPSTCLGPPDHGMTQVTASGMGLASYKRRCCSKLTMVNMKKQAAYLSTISMSMMLLMNTS